MKKGFAFLRTKLVGYLIFLFIINSVGSSLLVSCSSRQPEGVKLILPKGDQLAESIVWSPVDSNHLLASPVFATVPPDE
jgi:hypothetical protein